MKKIEIIDFKDEHDEHTLDLFYRTVFHNRKEFEYARLPTWSHRYSFTQKSIKRLAVLGKKIVGSLGLLSYEGYVLGKKKKIGFFVDNCVAPDNLSLHDEIILKLFQDVEKQAKKEKIQIMVGWEYTKKTDLHEKLFKSMGYSRVDGVNWFGGGTKHVDMFPINGFNVPLVWRIGLKLLNYKHHFHEAILSPLKHEKIRKMNSSDLPAVIRLINEQNKNLEFSLRYTPYSLRKTLVKYCAHGTVVEINGKIEGVLIYFLAPWSGWMYGKPTYTKSHSMFLIRHPLEFAVNPKHAERIAAHLLFQGMKEEKRGKYTFFVGVFDRRVEWMRKAFFDVGADEPPYDYGTLLIKNIEGKKLDLKKPVYVPTNLMISPYTEKDY